MLEMQIDALEKQRADMQKPLFEKLIADESVFKKAYDVFINENDSFLMKDVLRKYETPLEAYNNSTMVSSIVQTHFAKIVPDAFVALNAVKEKLETAKKMLKSLKK